MTAGDTMEKTGKGYLRMGNNYFKIHNFFKARMYYIRAVNMGNSAAADALFHMGQMYMEQHPPKYEDALDCFLVLSRRGHGPACMVLGEMNEKGKGLHRNIPKAFEYYAEAYAQGELGAAYKAGCLMLADALETLEVRNIAISWFDEALQEGDLRAYGRIGQLYISSHIRQTRSADIKAGITWLSKGAVKGDGLSLFLLSDCFMKGEGVPPDRKRAVLLLEQAVEKGYAKAMWKLGSFYEKGLVVSKDFKQAGYYYKMAREHGFTDGLLHSPVQQDYLEAQNYLNGRGVKKDTKRALDILKLCAAKGVGKACRQLGEFFETNEEESVRNAGKALLWYKRGMDMGHQASRNEFVRLSIQLGNQYEDRLRPYDMWRNASETLDNNEELRSRFKMMASRAAQHYLAAAKCNSREGWGFLAQLLLYTGDWLGVPEGNFLDAAKKGIQSRKCNVWKLLWQYYDGKYPHPYLAYHNEDPDKAFEIARRLAKKGDPYFCSVVAGYYLEGYGTYKDFYQADWWSKGVIE